MDTKKSILIVDKDVRELDELRNYVRPLQFRCISTDSHFEALELAFSEHPNIIILGLPRIGKDEVTVLEKVKNYEPGTSIIVITNRELLKSAKGPIDFLALEYLQKPVSPEVLKTTIQRIIKCNKPSEKKVENSSNEVVKFGDIIAKSQVMQELFRKSIKIAQSDANVFIYGESGTGKELFAQNIHAYSQRGSKDLIPVDCVALPDYLLESELFGYEKGAFTGAETMHKGLLEYANESTLFLDEICELPLNLQAKLLRAIQQHEFRRIGGKELIKVKLRIISASNKEPRSAVRKGLLREDLYYRLNVVPLTIPPLRMRKEDIPVLVNYFLNKFSKNVLSVKKSIERPAMDALMNYSWPGNVRELENLIEQLVALVDGSEIHLADLPQYIISTGSISELEKFTQEANLPYYKARKQFLEEFDMQYFQNLVEKCDGNLSKAAKLAQINRTTLYRKLSSIALTYPNDFH
ncbi:MAG: response regulator [Aliifodinibius sp.]|nr:sigma-54-dependent Fis family transcriptional regulator [Fodinibius sp.]NIV14839.1 response regulator [Fodinibius sp.]NIY28718.1 response regulator [Fodinibius sp.]